jgi:hypothetical protein
MTEEIAFDRERAVGFVKSWELWPQTGRAEDATARQWWLDLLERVVWEVNEHDWNDEVYPEDKYTEYSERAAESMVAQAKKNRAVMMLCDLSEVGKLLDPNDGGVYSRLTTPLTYPDGFDERGLAAAELLTLGSVTEIYLVSAASDVARSWCEEMVEDWREANPEPEDDEDEEE